MKEKLKIVKNYVYFVKPISWYSKSFTAQQILKYGTLEKETLALVTSIMNFRDMIEAAPITFIITDSQPLLWALKHRESNLKISRWVLKLFELNINFIVSHTEGSRNLIADFLSRIHMVPEEITDAKHNLKLKSAVHIRPSFNPLQVLTPKDILDTFAADPDIVTACKKPDLCHLNVNCGAFRNLGPYEITETCLDDELQVKSISTKFGFAPDSLEDCLTYEKIVYEQQKDPILSEIIHKIDRGIFTGNYRMRNGLLYKSFPSKDNILRVVVPKVLVNLVLAKYHFMTHAGVKKLILSVRLNYYWKNLERDAQEFTKGCVLCNIFKHTNVGETEFGTPRIIHKPLAYWQMDVVSGLISVNGSSSFLNMVELYSGLSVPVLLKGETSKEIAIAIENSLIKVFGVPLEISCDNAANLGGPEVRKLLDFYGIKLRRTVPYSPQSHAIVENSNKYLVILIRIFSEQFKVPWTNVLTLAALICNSVPRYQLKGHSPYFIIFLREPLTDENMVPINIEEDLDVEDRIKKLQNGRNYLRLINEYLLASRDTQNKKIGKKYISYPVGTMFLVKDNRPKAHKKLFPVYFKCPEKVIFEYTSVILPKTGLDE